MSIAGLRVFTIENPYQPFEVAYFTAPVQSRAFPEGSNWAYSSPTFAPERKEIWSSEAYTGSSAVRLTNGAWPDPVPSGPDPIVPEAPRAVLLPLLFAAILTAAVQRRRVRRS